MADMHAEPLFEKKWNRFSAFEPLPEAKTATFLILFTTFAAHNYCDCANLWLRHQHYYRAFPRGNTELWRQILRKDKDK